MQVLLGMNIASSNLNCEYIYVKKLFHRVLHVGYTKDVLEFARFDPTAGLPTGFVKKSPEFQNFSTPKNRLKLPRYYRFLKCFDLSIIVLSKKNTAKFVRRQTV